MYVCLWMAEPSPQARFQTCPSSRKRATIAFMFNDSMWEMRDYPRLFRVQRAAELGITRHGLLCSGRYPVVLPGIRMDLETFDRFRTPRWAGRGWESDALRLRAALLKFPRIAASYATAARIYGWPLPPCFLNAELHVCSEDMNARIRMPRVSLHRTLHFSPQQWLDLPVVDPTEVFISLGPDLSLRDLVKLGDAAVGKWHGPPQTTISTLHQQIDRRSRVRRRHHLLHALSLVRPTVDSPAETDLRLWARAVGLPEPVVHPQIASRLLRRVIEPDLGYQDAKLALEYEGEHHLRSRDQWNRDIERDEAMRYEGWTVLKVTSRTDYRLLESKVRHHLGMS